MSKDQLKDLAERATWTFLQGFFGSFMVTIPLVVDAAHTGSFSALKAALISALGGAAMAGFSAVKTYFIAVKK